MQLSPRGRMGPIRFREWSQEDHPMQRILLCLPLCLCLGSDRPREYRAPRPTAALVAFADEGKSGALPSQNEMERLARTDPLAFLQAALRRYNRENIQGY